MVDWKRLFIAVGLAYPLAMAPVGMTAMKDYNTAVALTHSYFDFLFSRDELFLTFAVLSFSAIGTLLTNSREIDWVVSVGCVLNILIGIVCLFIAIEMDETSILLPGTKEAVLFWSPVIMSVSFAAFCVCNIKSDPERSKNSIGGNNNGD